MATKEKAKITVSILINERAETETENATRLQHDGWQSILNNFKKYVETN